MIVSIVCIVFSALFWSMGGNTLSEWLNKKYKLKLHFSSLWRKTGVPILMGVATWAMNMTWWSLLQGLAMFGALFGTIALSGYGVDSVIYRLVRRVTKNDGWLTQFVTRTINGLLWASCSVLLLGSVKATIVYIVVGSVLMGIIGAGARVAVVSELLIGAVVGAMMLIKRRKK